MSITVLQVLSSGLESVALECQDGQVHTPSSAKSACLSTLKSALPAAPSGEPGRRPRRLWLIPRPRATCEVPQLPHHVPGGTIRHVVMCTGHLGAQ